MSEVNEFSLAVFPESVSMDEGDIEMTEDTCVCAAKFDSTMGKDSRAGARRRTLSITR